MPSQVPEELQLGMARLISNTKIGSQIEQVPKLAARLDAIMPEARVGEHYSIASKVLGPTDQGARLQLTKFAIHLLSNDLVDATCEMRGTIIQWLHHHGNLLLLESLLSVQEPTIEALKEAIFRIAILAQDIDILKVVLRSGININDQRVDLGLPCTPLQSVCKAGNLDMTRLLIEAGADVDARGDPRTSSPLASAACSGNTEILKIMISANADVNSHGESSQSALQAAIAEEGIDSVQVLLSAGADVHYANKNWDTALHDAAGFYNTELIELLIRAGADVNATNWHGLTALDAVIKDYLYRFDGDKDSLLDQNLEEVRPPIHCLLNYGPRRLESALSFAVHQRDAKLVRKILKTGLHVDSPIPFLLLDFDDSEFLYVTALTIAAFYNNAELVTLFLEAKADVDGDALEITPLQAASLHDSPEILQRLLFHGADLNQPAHEVTTIYAENCDELEPVGTALQTAAFKGHLVQCNVLLAAGADVNAAVGEMGLTALQAAVQSQNATLVKILLEAGAYINAPASRWNGLTALQAAVDSGSHYLVKYLLSKGADINAPAALPHQLPSISRGMTALTAAAHHNNQQLVSLLLMHGADINNSSPKKGAETAITAAVKNGNEELVWLLFASGAKVDDSNALLAATENKNIQLVHLLLWARTSFLSLPMKEYGSTALEWAVRQGQYDLVRTFLASGIDVNEPVLSPIGEHFRFGRTYPFTRILEAALFTGSPVMVEILLKSGADPNPILPEESMSILQLAADLKRWELARKILHAGADLNAPARGKRGRTALQAAAEKGCLDFVEVLLEAGADVNAPPAEDRGITALQAAAIGGYCGIVLKLLKAGADVNAAAASEDGRTAIEGASEYGRIDVLQLLLDNGALIDGPGRAQYDNAVSFAVNMGHPTARRVLQSHHRTLYGNI